MGVYCEICYEELKNRDYDYCYPCFQKVKRYCIVTNCDNIITKPEYKKCYTCSMKGKVKCPMCPKMRDPKYKMCYSCLQKSKT